MGPARRSQARGEGIDLEGNPLPAFEALFHTTFGSVRRSLARLGVPHRDQSDLAQDVFLAAYRNLDRYDPSRAPMRAWLHGITTNLASHYREKAQNRREELAPEPGSSAIADEPSAEERLLAHQSGLLVQELILRVDPKLRAVMVAHDIDGVPMTEIAAGIGIPTSTAYKWLYRARHAFRVAFERRLLREGEPGVLERRADGFYTAREHVTLTYGVSVKHGFPEIEAAQPKALPSIPVTLVALWLASLNAPNASNASNARNARNAPELGAEKAPSLGPKAPAKPQSYGARARRQQVDLAIEPVFDCRVS